MRKRSGGGRINVGRTFADKDNPGHWYVYLRVDGIYLLCRWEEGVLRTKLRNEVRLDAFDFPVYQLLARWGITSATLDAFMERSYYRDDADVKNVRATRRPINGRTIEHVRPRHRVDPVVGGG